MRQQSKSMVLKTHNWARQNGELVKVRIADGLVKHTYEVNGFSLIFVRRIYDEPWPDGILKKCFPVIPETKRDR